MELQILLLLFFFNRRAFQKLEGLGMRGESVCVSRIWAVFMRLSGGFASHGNLSKSFTCRVTWDVTRHGSASPLAPVAALDKGARTWICAASCMGAFPGRVRDSGGDCDWPDKWRGGWGITVWLAVLISGSRDCIPQFNGFTFSRPPSPLQLTLWETDMAIKWDGLNQCTWKTEVRLRSWMTLMYTKGWSRYYVKEDCPIRPLF